MKITGKENDIYNLLKDNNNLKEEINSLQD